MNQKDNEPVAKFAKRVKERAKIQADRKSTRLNSSHANISYAVFCLKKKKILCRLLRVRNKQDIVATMTKNNSEHTGASQ